MAFLIPPQAGLGPSSQLNQLAIQMTEVENNLEQIRRILINLRENIKQDHEAISMEYDHVINFFNIPNSSSLERKI